MTVFDEDEVNIYDTTDVKITTTRGAILGGWRMPHYGLWRIPLKKGVTANSKHNITTRTVNTLPVNLLKKILPPLPNSINSLCDLKTKSEWIRCYHTAVGLPTKPTWIAAITNQHYIILQGLDATSASNYLPDSDEIWKGHGRKVNTGL
jgi:hypothetical protein